MKINIAIDLLRALFIAIEMTLLSFFAFKGTPLIEHLMIFFMGIIFIFTSLLIFNFFIWIRGKYRKKEEDD